MIATTINMHCDTLAAISRASTRLQQSRRDVVVRLLMRVMHNINLFTGGIRTVSYQPDDSKEKWHCHCIKFREDEYEYFTDLRKICKCSVSLLVAIAVKEYLDEILREIGKGIHNYKAFSCYMLQRERNNKIICWRIYWGFPGPEAIPKRE